MTNVLAPPAGVRWRLSWRVGRAALFALVYFAVEAASIAFEPPGSFASQLWLPSGLLLAALLRVSVAEWPEFLLAAFLAGTISGAGPDAVSSLVTLANLAEAVTGAAIIRRILGAEVRLDRIRGVMTFCVIPGVVSVPFGALLVTAVLHYKTGADFESTWRLVWIANSLGVIATTPLLLAWTSGRRPWESLDARKLKLLVVMVVVAAVLASLMVRSAHIAHPIIPYGWLFLPLFMWCSLQFDTTEVTLLSFLMCITLVFAASHGRSPLGAELTANTNMTLLDLLLSAMTYSSLFITAARAESTKALAASEASARQYRELFEDSIQGIFRSLPGGTFIAANPALARMHGYDTPEEFMQRSSTPQIYSDNEQRRALLDELARHGVVRGYSLHILKRTGEPAWHSVNARLVRGSDGKPAYYEGMVEDVTERKLAELERQFLTFSLGERVKELTGLHQVSRILQDDQLDTIEILRRVIAIIPPAFQFPSITAARIRYDEHELTTPAFAETPWMLRAIHRIRDDVSVTLDVVYLEERPPDDEGPFFFEERNLVNSLVEMVGVALEHREAEEAYHRSQERLQLALAASGMRVWEFDVESRSISWSDQAGGTSGVSGGNPTPLEEFLGIVHPDDRTYVINAMELALNDPTREGVFGMEYRRIVDGVPRWFTSSGRVQHDAEGRPVNVLGLSHDVTDLRQLEEQFHQSQKLEAVGQLAGGVAHDFNNLLTVMSGYLEMLLQSDLEEEQSREALGELERLTHRAESLTRQLLAFSRKSVVAPITLDMSAQVSDMQKLLGRLVGERIELVLQLDASGAKVRADPAQIEQMVMNLVVNGRDATPAGGKITVITKTIRIDEDEAHLLDLPCAGHWFVLSVRDTGTGMDEATRARIFEPFFTTKAAGKGTGMGLSVVLGVVERTNGHVRVESTPGTGTTFTVYLPIADEMHTAPAPVRISGPVARRGTERILLVEDDDALRQVVVMALESQGYTVRAARHGEEALSFVESGEPRYDLLLTDVVLPRVGGRELARQIFGHNDQTRVLFMSGYTDDSVLVHGVEAGQVNFLQKPFSPTTLVKKVREVLDA